MTPLETFLLEKRAAEKKAGFMSSFRQSAKQIPEALGAATAQGAATAAVGAGIAGIGMAASKIYDAMTKRRDFQQMLKVNPDLAEHQAANPAMFNHMFSSLRVHNPAFTADPIVAGTYMRRMSESPLTAGGVAVEALGHRESTKSPQLDAFLRGGFEGAKSGVKSGFDNK
jgi:hypothetical protein